MVGFVGVDELFWFCVVVVLEKEVDCKCYLEVEEVDD